MHDKKNFALHGLLSIGHEGCVLIVFDVSTRVLGKESHALQTHTRFWLTYIIVVNDILGP